MTSELPTLTILPVNKTVVFYSPIEGKDVLVRTGTISEGSCFFHAMLHSYSKDYVSMNTNGRMKFVKRLRASIARKVDKDRWESLSNGLIAKIPFQENINGILSDFYRYIERGGSGRTKSVRKVIREVIKDDKNDTEAYKLVTEMVPLDKGFEKSILPSAYEKCNEGKLSECKETIVEYSIRYYKKEFKKLEGQLEPERVEYYISKLKKFIQAVVEESENTAYNEYVESLHDTSMEVDSYTIGLISEKFNRDIYFIDARTRMPYRDANTENIRKRKSIIVMWTGGCHYEIVGRLLAGNRIQREFDFRDPLIKRIYTYLCKPARIPNEYPNLIPYLPKDLRKKLHIDVSDSEEDRRSDRSYGSDNDGKYVSSDDEFENSSAYEQSGSDYDNEPIKESKGYEHNKLELKKRKDGNRDSDNSVESSRSNHDSGFSSSLSTHKHGKSISSNEPKRKSKEKLNEDKREEVDPKEENKSVELSDESSSVRESDMGSSTR